MVTTPTSRRRGARSLGAVAAAVALGTALSTGGSSAVGATRGPLRVVKVLHAADRASGFKAASSRLAKSDAALLRATSSATVRVIVKLDYDGLARYAGGLRGLAATSPSVTGRRLGASADRSTARGYRQYIGGIEGNFEAALARAVPAARVVARFHTVYGGVALTIAANRAKDLLHLPGVVAVQSDAINHPLTDASSDFIGANTIYNQLGSDTQAGHGVIVGVLDTGLWPEHPSFADDGSYPAPRPRADGQPRVCNYGDNPLTPQVDVFACNNKLIGGEIFNSGGVAQLYADTARDSDGHGTHTSSTAAGGPLEHAVLQGVDRGPIHGIAPGAAVIMYKVCQPNGCSSIDTMNATEAAIDDGVDVINYSISGGTVPFQDPTELAFLDAYAAGVFVSASAGNSGPTAATANHLSPWVTTVAASTQRRAFAAAAHLTSTDGATLSVTGASVMGGLATAAPVVNAADSGDPLCQTPAAPGSFAGMVVVCQRGVNARVDKGYNVLQGGAVGMILFNPAVADLETDNHWLPAVHVDYPEGQQVVDFLAAHGGVTATLDAGAKVNAQGDVMAAFSSRGPAGDWLKPDITAPGVQILAGDTPTPEPGDTTLGPPGSYFQAIAGTSMSSPHIAGSGALLKALHPDWTPGQIKSAIMTTANEAVVKEDGVTPADPYDYGSGRVDLHVAGDPGLTISDSAANMANLGMDPATAIDINIASVNAGLMPGEVRTTRTVQNVTNHTMTFDVSTATVAGAAIVVSPSHFSVAAGAAKTLSVSIAAPTLADGMYFGEIDLGEVGGNHHLHLPVAFNKTQASVSLAQGCERSTLAVGARTTCAVTATNNSLSAVHVDLNTRTNSPLAITSANGATLSGGRASASVDLPGKAPGNPSIGPGLSPAGYLALSDFGITPDPIGDEDILNYTGVGNFQFAGDTYSSVGITSDGYAVVGGGTISDVSYIPQALPDSNVPNNVLAPFWTDLDGTNTAGVYAAVLSDGVSSWVVFEWQVQICCSSDTTTRVFQLWIGLNGSEDISYAYDPANLPAAPPAGYGLSVGAENLDGSAGGMITDPTPIQDYVVTSTGGAPGGSYTYTVRLKGRSVGTGLVVSRMTSPAVRGTTIVTSAITVTAPPGRTLR